MASSLICTFCKKAPQEGQSLKRCAKCNVAKYCSRECQLAHWQHPISPHRLTCSVQGRAKSIAAAGRIDSQKVSVLSHQLGFGAYRGDLALCKQLLSQGANCRDYADPNDGATALFAAASGQAFGEIKGQHVEVMKELIAHGAPLMKAKTNSIMDTPLHGAAGAGALDRVKLLVAHGADVHARCKAGTPLDMAKAQFYNDCGAVGAQYDRVVAFLENAMAHATMAEEAATEGAAPPGSCDSSGESMTAEKMRAARLLHSDTMHKHDKGMQLTHLSILHDLSGVSFRQCIRHLFMHDAWIRRSSKNRCDCCRRLSAH